MNKCPTCGSQGRRVEAVTLEAHVAPARLDQIADRDGWRICTSAQCEVVYFRDAETVPMQATLAVPFHKSDAPDRLVCFCFGHTVSEVQAEVREHGTSSIQESIKAACKEGRDDCERKNPQGRCCLGNVGAVVKAAGEAGARPTAAPIACCASTKVEGAPAQSSTATTATARTGLVASGGALVAAVLSSACCWLPLAAIALGASSAGVGGFFEAWRVPLLLVAVGLLGVGFYLVYRKPRCAPGEACEVPNPRLQRFNRGMLWMTTALVAAFAFFPEYVGAVTGGGGEVVEAAPQQTTVHYTVEGMTCAGCEAHAREAIEAIPGVASVAVSYQQGSAEVIWRDAPDHEAVSAAIAEFGYRARHSG